MSNPPRTCPNCKVQIPIDKGFTFDDDLNMICEKCSKIAYPVCNEAESTIIPQFGQKVVVGKIYNVEKK